MDDAISEYQKWKQQGNALRVQAKQAMENRFRDVLMEAARISQEYQADFGTVLKPPPQITAFRFKAVAKNSKDRKAAPKKASAPPEATQKPADTKKVSALEKRLAQARVKLQTAKTAGKPTRNLEDSVYEIEDELRLAHVHE